MRIVILGAVGSMAIECTRDFARTADFNHLVLADVNLNLLNEVARELNDDRISIIRMDAHQKEELRAVMQNCDFFINGMPSDFSANVCEAAIDVGISGTDITGLANMFDFNKRTAERKVLIVAGMGCTPGITNVMARYGSDQLEQLDEIDIYFAAWRPIGLSPGLVDFTIWALHPNTSQRCYYEEGQFIPVEPFSGKRAVRFMDPIGEQWVYYLPHQETITLPRYLLCRRVATLGTYPSQDMELFRYLWKYGFLRDEPVRGLDVSPLQFVRSHLKEAPEAREKGRMHYALMVEVKGRIGDKEITHRLAASHPSMDHWGGQSVYAKFTGIPLSVGSQLLISGKAKGKGVLAPEACIPPEEFIAELKRRGILFEFEKFESSKGEEKS